ncbi:Uma2 family endonuclease [Candidatus Entotheonella palauensis]|uniref:Uma2 family endonuclease n=1 Tax=Candidatus Entotheonella palauensis TaxID=93172 RepID=UPI000B7D0ED2|nr:Uma2 family endonuclease [Candidatus Entotheonella palauensis]
MRNAVQDKVIEYPDSDGMPMADNTLQFQWIVTLKEEIGVLFRDHPDVFVAGDLLWYPVEGRPDIRVAPDVLVAFGRPKGYRGSYRQWVEDGIAPQVVFEVRSPGNREAEMNRKLRFYDTYGVEEYYLYDPNRNTFAGWRRTHTGFEPIPDINNWVSPRLGIRFELHGEVFTVTRPDGRQFLTFDEMDTARVLAEQERQQAQQERQQAQQERQQAEREQQQAEQGQQQALAQAEQERQRAERLTAQLRALGIEPEV